MSLGSLTVRPTWPTSPLHLDLMIYTLFTPRLLIILFCLLLRLLSLHCSFLLLHLSLVPSSTTSYVSSVPPFFSVSPVSPTSSVPSFPSFFGVAINFFVSPMSPASSPSSASFFFVSPVSPASYAAASLISSVPSFFSVSPMTPAF